MGLSTTPAVTLDSDYAKSHGADTACPERTLWLAVIAQAGADLFSSDERVRRDAASFFAGDDLLRVLNLAGISHAEAPWLRRRALELVEASPDTPQTPGKRITYKNQTRTLTQWSKATGISIHALGYRLRRGWPIGRALTTSV